MKLPLQPTRFICSVSVVEHVGPRLHTIAWEMLTISQDIIRAVAGLLYNMHAIKTENNTFDADYSRGLQIYADLTDGITSNSPGAVGPQQRSTEELHVNIKPPVLQFSVRRPCLPVFGMV